MTTLREKKKTTQVIIIEHDRLFSRKWKFACSIFLWAAGIYKKTTDTLTYKHYNIIGFVIKKRVKNWKQKLKQREKKIIITKKTVFLILCAAPLLCVLPIIKKNFKLCKTNQQDLKNTHCKRQSLLYVKLRSATEENL